ncbi:MAG: YlxR family protein [Firmicutes bacterium]|nr:YlxR family protein [Bacillota bacterium]
MKKIPQRMCLITREKYDKRDLIRVVRNKELGVLVDDSGKVNGKGAYLKKDKEVIEKAKKLKALDRALEVSIPDSIYEELLNKVNE